MKCSVKNCIYEAKRTCPRCLKPYCQVHILHHDCRIIPKTQTGVG